MRIKRFKCGFCKKKPDNVWRTRKDMRRHLREHIRNEFFNKIINKDPRTWKKQDWIIEEEW